jgi:hypothetical protein
VSPSIPRARMTAAIAASRDVNCLKPLPPDDAEHGATRSTGYASGLPVSACRRIGRGCIREITSGLAEGGRAVGCGWWCGVNDLNEGPSEPDSRLSVIYARAMAAYNRGRSVRVFSEQHAHAIVFDGACRGRITSRDGALAAAPRQADDRPRSDPRCADAFRTGTAVLPLPGATAGLHEDRGGSLKTGTPSGGDTR